jgi:hypothetical protein
MRKWLPLIIVTGGFGISIAFRAGIIRPPRPMFHEAYAAGGFGLLPTWQPNPMFADERGQWLYFDEGDNLIVVQATGTGERGRSKPMTGGTRAARFRLGSAWDDVEDSQYVRVPRTRDKLVVILPDGRWETFPIGPGRATQVYRDEVGRDNPNTDLIKAVGSILGGAEKARFEGFLKQYKPPER